MIYGKIPSPTISVVVPTRERPHQLIESIKSLQITAADFSRVEVVVQIDYEDRLTLARIGELAAMNVRVVVSPRGGGYADVHRYFAECIQASFAPHILVWSDNTRMLTYGWDSRIASIEHELYHGTFNSEHGWRFPFVPRKLCDIIGGLGPRPYIDVWVGDICTNWASGVPFVYFDDVMLEHDGPPPTALWDERDHHRQKVVDYNVSVDQNTPEIHALKMKDHMKLKQYLALKEALVAKAGVGGVDPPQG
jgi:hypothetical protein